MHLGHQNFEDRTVLEKQYLLKNDPTIIFAGDSRAERHLVPQIATDILNQPMGKIVNIALAGADPLMLLPIVRNNPKTFKNALVIISMSANQFNDGALKRGYFSKSMISKLSYSQQFEAFFPSHIKTLQDYYKTAIIQLFTSPQPPKRLFESSYGFMAVDGKLDSESLNLYRLKKNPWYKNFKISNTKKQLISSALQQINMQCGSLFVISAPFPPSYLKIIKGEDLDQFEIDFQQQLKETCNHLDILYHSFQNIEGLHDHHFYDSSHLNVEGAKIFTKHLIKSPQFIYANQKLTNK
jgi:hypothetical protein